MVEEARRVVGGEEVLVMLEAGTHVWAPLLHAAGAVVHVVDPKQARRYAESQCSSGAKDDRRDAASLLDMSRSAAHRRAAWRPATGNVQQLEILGLLHEQRTTDLTRSKQRVREMVRRTMPLVEQALPEDLDSAWVDVFLRAVPTAWHAARLEHGALTTLMPRARKTTRAAMWDAMTRTAAPWLAEEVAETYALAVRSELDQSKLLAAQLDEVERQMDALTRDSQGRSLFETMAGIGLLMAVALTQHGFCEGSAGGRDDAAVRMGASPVFSGSATTAKGAPKGRTRMRRATSSRARRATYLLGRLASQNLSWAKAMYADGRSRGQPAATVYRRIARCVLRILTAMLRDNEPYDEQRYVAALKAKGVPWAAELAA
jgi:transposase